MFNKLLIANRGEIACRVIRTARDMGIKTVAVYSDADRDARHVALADESFYLGESAPASSYLRGELIIDIAKKCGAEAIHPGYGFLSENAEFARACEANGIAFVGPGSDAIDAMGSKSAAKLIMEKAGVPLVPGYHGDDQSDATLLAEAKKIGYPLLIKAAYGGGGKGMRIVEGESELKAAIDSARREAASSFGNDKLLMERYLRQPRHVEVQVFADSHGNCVYLSDRDCSIQRRHQKVVEEAPAPGLPDSLRRQMGEAAVAAAKAIDYRGAGTVEFLLDAPQPGKERSFFFMEMNTRLQVEHPVTEMVTGQDLVKWQLLVASGSMLPLEQHEIQIHGHSFEVRIYAEDPNNEFLPASGKLTFLREPEPSRHVRIDSGVRENDVISNYYDPMIAKLIVWDESRPRALARLNRALGDYRVGGLKHNIEFLSNIAEHPAFSDANFSTDFIGRYGDALIGDSRDEADTAFVLAVLTQLKLREATTQDAPGHDPFSPWSSLKGFRLSSPRRHSVTLLDDAHQSRSAELTESNGRYQLSLNDKLIELSGSIEDRELKCEINGHKMKVTVSLEEGGLTVFLSSGSYHFREVLGQVLEETASSEDKLKAPMNGTVVTHLVAVGDTVTAGQGLLVMEAMKMEYTIEAPFDGVVSEFFFAPGELVSDGTLLLALEPADAVAVSKEAEA